MNKIAELEIGLHRREAETYAVEFRFSQPESDAEVRLGQGVARFDLNTLAKLPPGDLQYGQALTKSLFDDAAVQTAFAQAFASSVLPTPAGPSVNKGLPSLFARYITVDISSVEIYCCPARACVTCPIS